MREEEGSTKAGKQRNARMETRDGDEKEFRKLINMNI